jgi:hypothetical protein
MHHDAPILSDLLEEIYLAPEYEGRHEDRLTDLGVQMINWTDIVDRLQADLSNTSSKVKTIPANDSWHESFADLFSKAFRRESSETVKNRIRKLPIIPLNKVNQWTGTPGFGLGGLSKIYFPVTGTTPIPESLGLNLLDQSASRNIKRRALYKNLGVEECPKATVFTKILLMHSGPFAPAQPIDHFRYMFYQQYGCGDVRSWIWVPLEDRVMEKARLCDLYFPSAGEFDTYQLLPTHTDFRFLSIALVDAVLPTVRVDNDTWQTWLARITGAKYHPSLTDVRAFGSTWYSLSAALKAVLSHAPTQFLGTLRAHWGEYQSQIHLVSEELRECKVPCTSGTSIKLSKTYLPTLAIREALQVMRIRDAGLPLLKLPETLDNSSYRSWKFLEEFGVGSKPDLTFYLLAVGALAQRGEPKISSMIEIFQSMARLATVENHAEIR